MTSLFLISNKLRLGSAYLAQYGVVEFSSRNIMVAGNKMGSNKDTNDRNIENYQQG